MKNKDIKKLIAPFQALLIQKGKCVGCFSDLSTEKKEDYNNNLIRINCKCGRIFIYEGNSKYRRALMDEMD